MPFTPRVKTCPRPRARRAHLHVACIGSGPASLACAAELCRQGASATIIERRLLPGGLNTYGVAEYKLRAAESLREVEMIRRMGVEFRFGASIESAAALAALESEFDFIFLGVGLGAMQQLNIPGEDSKGVMNALELIAAYKTGRIREITGTVVVVGAGNTAIDAANAARRLGAETVYLLYRRGESDIAAFDFEYEHAKQEGVQFLWRRQPVAIRPDAHGRLLLDTVQVREIDTTLLPIPGSEFTIACHLVVPAIGQSPLTKLMQRISPDRSAGRKNRHRPSHRADAAIPATLPAATASMAAAKWWMPWPTANAPHSPCSKSRRPPMPDIRVRSVRRRHRLAQSVLAGFRTAHQLRRADHARL